MNRRDFLVSSGLGVTPPLLGGLPRLGQQDLYAYLVGRTEEVVERYRDRQVLTAGSPHHGGMPDRHGFHTAHGSAALLRYLATAWACPESRFHRSGELVERMAAATRHLLAKQHDDGTIDLHTTNFHSPPDVAFAMENVGLALTLLRARGGADAASLDAGLLEWVERAGGALAVGGIHTPNHRWVVCAALARANALAPDPRYEARADEWLAEKIDLDPDGQYNERSTAVYSPITNRSFVTAARLFGKPELLEPVRRNLEMTLHYLHADGTVATEGSRRQDQFTRGSASGYHYSCRYLALLDRNPRFAAFAARIAEVAPERLTSELGLMLEDPSILEPLPEPAALPDDFVRHFAHSDLVRFRRGKVSASFLGQNATFFSLHKGSASVAVRFAQAFFGKGQFVGERVRRDGEAWILEQEMTGPYYQPLAKEHLPGDGDWDRMNRGLRPQSEVQYQSTRVRLTEQDGDFTLQIEIEGTDHVPVAVEIACGEGSALDGVTAVEDLEGAWLLTSESGRCVVGDDAIEFGPGRSEHRWTNLRGALPKLAGDCVYLTGHTPFSLRLRLR